MPQRTCHWHSGYDHGQEFGFPESVPRLFDEDDYEEGPEAHMEGEPWTFVSCPCDTRQCDDCYDFEPIAHKDAIIISVDGACRGNGGLFAVSGIGVFLHKNSSFNCAKKVDTPYTHTSQRAELLAGLEGLRIATEIQQQNPGKRRPFYVLPDAGPCRKLRHVVIKSDSKYLVGAMTGWIFKWKRNSYTNAKGGSVVNEDLFRRLEQAIDQLNAVKVDVQFWHVSRTRNVVADRLANAALNGYDAEEALEDYFDDD